MRIRIQATTIATIGTPGSTILWFSGKKKKCCKSYKDGKRCKDCPKKKK